MLGGIQTAHHRGHLSQDVYYQLLVLNATQLLYAVGN